MLRRKSLWQYTQVLYHGRVGTMARLLLDTNENG